MDRIVIVITGNPATGKTTVAKELNQNGISTYNLFDLAERENCIEAYDEKRGAHIINEDCLISAIRQLLETAEHEPIVFEAHYGDLVPVDVVDLCFVLSEDNNTLKRRYEERGYTETKIRENLEAQIFEECYYDALEAYGEDKVEKIEPGELKEIISVIMDKIKGLQG